MEPKPEFNTRIDAAVAAWKTKLKLQQEASKPGSHEAHSGLPSLQAAATDLERDLSDVLKAIDAETARVRVLETRAMDAIRTNDDYVARESLLALQECADTLKQLDADATVIRAMLAECRAVLDHAAE